jgi:uncharacterized protein (TIGR00645 family)
VEKTPLADPFLFLDQLRVHDRDLAGRSAEADESQLQPKTQGFAKRGHRCGGHRGGIKSIPVPATSRNRAIRSKVTHVFLAAACPPWLFSERPARSSCFPPVMSKPDSPIEKFLEGLIFSSRWLQAPLYLGLIVAQAIYVYRFLVELVHLAHMPFDAELAAGAPDLSIQIMLSVLGLIDVVMIANLLIMVIIGGYETFVSRLHLGDHEDQPEWLSHVNAGALKVKLATALIGISSIHLLKTFIEVRMPNPIFNNYGVMWQVIIHLAFVVSAIALAYADRLMMNNAKANGESRSHGPFHR